MVDETDLLPTPANYATPNQLALAREYAKALMWGNQTKGNGLQFQPVSHWTQGVSNMINAMLGGKEMYDTRQQEMATNRAASNALPARQEFSPPTGYTSDADGGSPTQPPTRAAAFAGAPPMPGGGGMGRDYKPGIESDDSPLYEPRGTPPDNMDLPPNAPASFSDRWGPFGASAKPPAANMSALPFKADASAAANSGMAPPDAQSAIALALQKGGARAAPFGVPAGAPDTTYVDPRTLPKRPTIDRQSFEAIMSNPLASPEMKATAMKSYYEQFQPMDTTYPGGHVIVDPNSGAQRLVPDVKDNTTKLPGGVEVTRPGMVVPPNFPSGNFRYQTIDDVGGGAPGAAPVAPPAGNGPAIPSIKRPAPVAPNGALNFAPEEGDNGGGPLAFAPPGSPTAPVANAAGDAPAGPVASDAPGLPVDAGTQTAQLSPRLQQMYDWSRQKQLDFEKQKEFNTKDVDDFSKSYATLSDKAQTAAQSLPQLELAKSMVQDPRMYNGPASDWVQLYKQAQSLFGKDPNAAAPMEVFQKLISGEIIKDLRTELQGTGQVRLAEIDLLSKAAASTSRTKASNEAVLELMQRSRKLTSDIGQLANDYRQGYRFDKDGNAVQTNEVPSKAGLDSVIQQYIKANPIVTPQERSNYEKLFDKYDRNKYNDTKGALMGGEASNPPNASSKKVAPPPPPGFTVPK